jgi:hypothetical protein
MVVISILPHAESQDEMTIGKMHPTLPISPDGENITGNESASHTGRPRLVLIEFLLSCEG